MHMSKTKPPIDKKSTLPWKTFGEYVNARCEGKSLSKRQLAFDLEIDPAHLTRLTQNKVHPLPETCVKVARYFGDPAVIVLQLAGWIEDEDVDLIQFFAEFRDVMSESDDLRNLLAEFKKLETLDDRHDFIDQFVAFSTVFRSRKQQ